MEFKVGNRMVEVAFDYKTMFKVDKQLASKNPQTNELNNDGVGVLFTQVLNREDDAIINLIKVSSNQNKKALSEGEILDAVASYVEENGYIETFEELEKEMVDSGFFNVKISKYIENMEQAIGWMEEEQNKANSMEVKAIKGIIGKMKSALS
ncbi:tail assembly chaperone [Globicatella sanguinis]